MASPLAQEFEDTIAEPTRRFLDSIIGGYAASFAATVQVVDVEEYRCVCMCGGC